MASITDPQIQKMLQQLQQTQGQINGLGNDTIDQQTVAQMLAPQSSSQPNPADVAAVTLGKSSMPAVNAPQAVGANGVGAYASGATPQSTPSPAAQSFAPPSQSGGNSMPAPQQQQTPQQQPLSAQLLRPSDPNDLSWGQRIHQFISNGMQQSDEAQLGGLVDDLFAPHAQPQITMAGMPGQQEDNSNAPTAYKLFGDGSISSNPVPIQQPGSNATNAPIDISQMQQQYQFWMNQKANYARAGLYNPLNAQRAEYAQKQADSYLASMQDSQKVNEGMTTKAGQFGNLAASDPQAIEGRTSAKATVTLEQLEYDTAKEIQQGNLAGARQLVQTALDQLRPIEGVRPSGPQAEAFDTAFQNVDNILQKENGINAFLPANLAGTFSAIAALRQVTRSDFQRSANIAGMSPKEQQIELARGTNIDNAKVVAADANGKPLIQNGSFVIPAIINTDANGIAVYGVGKKPVNVTTIPVQWDPDDWTKNFEGEVEKHNAISPSALAQMKNVNDYQNTLLGAAQAQGTLNQTVSGAKTYLNAGLSMVRHNPMDAKPLVPGAASSQPPTPSNGPTQAQIYQFMQQADQGDQQSRALLHSLGQSNSQGVPY